MNLNFETLIASFRRRGVRFTVAAIAMSPLAGTVDQFTSRIIPGIASRIEERIHPPQFVIAFSEPLDRGELKPEIRSLPSIPTEPQRVAETDEKYIVVNGAPGTCRIELHRVRDGERSSTCGLRR